ncbi:MAG TPA: bifunctional phosphoribosylaminoimidazolecarboxamide formyltransferase/IMP cyclohydrolase [Acidimicrobiales bacterium]|nr:bifunctional phosphoribosylaminoimidazolecarboxamide formyltransferase/IMP cyclohydrolase [Acidimicrobiales bacterium]
MRALLSVYDKTGVVELAAALVDLGWDLVSSGGTARAVTAAGLPVVPVEEVTGSPEMLGHRVVTLHPALHGGILADRGDPAHVADLERFGITPIDLVVSNLYPFRSAPSIEMIDIGGPAMVRAAAKNHGSVGVVVDPADYGEVIDELRATGSLSEATRRRLARAAFAHTAAYDAAIVGWFDQLHADGLPPTIHLALERAEALRYGENPQQAGARYRPMGAASWWDDVVQHQGLALSYLNLYDADAAWALVHDLAALDAGAAVAIIKHANPCGAAVADDLASAYQAALEGDEQAAFGGIVALSGELDGATAERMAAGPQADVIIAPGYGDGVLEVLRARRKNTRVLSAPPPQADAVQLRQLAGAFLAQDAPRVATGRAHWRVVTKVAPTGAQWADAELAWRLCGHVKSNCVVLVEGGHAVGIGAGQQSRVGAAEIAAAKAAGRAVGGTSATDGFYPFPDGVEAAAAAGVAVVLQPGGSVRDDEVTATADRLGLAMVLTGERLFRH